MKTKIQRLSALLITFLILISSVNITAYGKSLSAPVSVSAYCHISGVKVKWKEVKGCSGYTVYKKSSKNGSWKKLANTEKKYFIDKSVKNKKTYYYSVKAHNSKKTVYSKRSKTAVCFYVAAPKTASIYEYSGNAVIQLKGTAAEWYSVFRKTGKNGKYKEVKTAEFYFNGKKDVRIEDPTVASCKTYYYKIKALEKDGTKKSAFSKAVKISCKYYAGECARNGHENLHKVKVVKPNEVLDGYTLYSCDCGKRVCARNITKATGNPAPHENEYAYNQSVKRYNSSVEYLDKVRKNDKKDLLQVFNGTTEQIRVLKKESDKIVTGCKTNYQKYKAIYNWINKNVESDDNASSYPFEVLRFRKGNCQGVSRLMVDLLRLQNIPCAVMIGYLGDTKNTLTEKNMASLCGARHDWVLAYVDSRWVFADALWSFFDPDKEDLDIPSRYYTVAADYCAVYYKGMNLKMAAGHPTYVNGKYFAFDHKGRQDFNSFGYFSGDFSFSCEVNDCISQKNKSESFTNYLNTENMRPGEVMSGPVYRRTKLKLEDEELTHITYYNGRNVCNTTYTIDGKKHLSVNKTYSAYSGKYLSMKYGSPVLKVGETINFKINLDNTLKSQNAKVKWSSEDKSIATVDKNGKVKAIGEGYTMIHYKIQRFSNNLAGEGSIVLYVDNSSIYTIKSSDMAPESEIRTQRCKIHF